MVSFHDLKPKAVLLFPRFGPRDEINVWSQAASGSFAVRHVALLV